MQLERARREASGFEWRQQSSIRKHVQKVKDVYYEMRRQMAALRAAGSCENAALDQVP